MMKRYLFISTFATILSLTLTNMAYADFLFHASDANACSNIAGQWSGRGVVSNWMIGQCVYHGTGTISPVDGAGNFTLDMTAQKDSGSIICPADRNDHLNGTCINGTATINTGYGNLVGNFSSTTGNASGTLTVSPGINADVNIEFRR